MSERGNGGATRMEGGPDGKPLGRAFFIGPGLANEPLREVIDVVAGVHGDGELPTIPIVWDSSLNVRVRFVIRDGLPSAITVHPGSALTVPIIHEIGHFLDFTAIDGIGPFASLFLPRFVKWQVLVNRTATFRALSESVPQALAMVPAAQAERRRLIAELRSPEEVWARSYTQYVIGRSERKRLVASFAAERTGNVEGFVFPLHRQEQEIAPIDQEIERLFRSLRWRRS